MTIFDDDSDVFLNHLFSRG